MAEDRRRDGVAVPGAARAERVPRHRRVQPVRHGVGDAVGARGEEVLELRRQPPRRVPEPRVLGALQRRVALRRARATLGVADRVDRPADVLQDMTLVEDDLPLPVRPPCARTVATHRARRHAARCVPRGAEAARHGARRRHVLQPRDGQPLDQERHAGALLRPRPAPVVTPCVPHWTRGTCATSRVVQ